MKVLADDIADRKWLLMKEFAEDIADQNGC
jgi:hypothetical protein